MTVNALPAGQARSSSQSQACSRGHPAECGDGGLSTRRTHKQQAPVIVWHIDVTPVPVQCKRAVREGPCSLSMPSCARLLAAVVAMI
jgi:hypothetical protein